MYEGINAQYYHEQKKQHHFFSESEFRLQLWISSRGEGSWKVVIGQTPRNTQATQA